MRCKSAVAEKNAVANAANRRRRRLRCRQQQQLLLRLLAATHSLAVTYHYSQRCGEGAARRVPQKSIGGTSSAPTKLDHASAKFVAKGFIQLVYYFGPCVATF